MLTDIGQHTHQFGDKGTIMAPSRDEILRRMLSTVPRCIKNFKVEPAKRPEAWDGADAATWQISCSCGCRHGSFLGYPLCRYNNRYSGRAFVGPLAFGCAECERVTEILDTDQHGYHADACAISQGHIRGVGRRDAFVCAKCNGERFEVVTSFFFWPASIDVVEDNPEEFETRAQDLFCEFVAHGHCAKCGQTSRLTDFGKL